MPVLKGPQPMWLANARLRRLTPTRTMLLTGYQKLKPMGPDNPDMNHVQWEMIENPAVATPSRLSPSNDILNAWLTTLDYTSFSVSGITIIDVLTRITIGTEVISCQFS